MSRFTKQITSYWQQFRTVVRNEYGSIFTDAGVILVLVLALLIYSTLYSLAYGTQVLRNVPIGVIDMSNTSTSRQLINTFNAGPNVYVAYEPGDMDEAKHLFYDREIYGVVYIPSDYEEKLLGGQQAVVSLYVDASYFLMYRQAFQELVSGIGTTGAMVEFQRLIAKGANIPQATATTQPVIYQSHNLFNPYLGYGSFVMPAIIMVIIQQTMLIGIGMIGGTWSEFGLYKKLIPPGRRRMSTLPVVAGKAFVYASIYAVTLFYILGLHYKLFHFPTNGHTADIIAFLIPYLLSLYFPGHRRLDAVPAARTVDHAVALVFDPGSDAQRSFRTPRSDARMALPVRPDSAEQQRGRRVHPAPKYGGFVQRRVARGTYPVDSHDSLRRIRCCRHTPSPQEGRR